MISLYKSLKGRLFRVKVNPNLVSDKPRARTTITKPLKLSGSATLQVTSAPQQKPLMRTLT